jgi:hypothetical protein
MTNVRNALKTCGISPKVLNSAIVGLIVAVLFKFGISIDSTLEQFINVAVMIVVGYLSPPGDVIVDDPEDPDFPGYVDPEGAGPQVRAEAGYGIVEIGLFLCLVLVGVGVLLALT